MTRKKGLPSVLDELRRNLEKLKLKAMARHLDEALEQATSLVVDAVVDVAEVLSQEQRQKIADHLESHRAMMEAMFREGR